MNKHPYPDRRLGPVSNLKDGPIWSMAVANQHCDECGSDAGYYCERTPPAKTAGKLRWPPHDSRVKKLMHANPQAGALRVISGDDLVKLLLNQKA